LSVASKLFVKRERDPDRKKWGGLLAGSRPLGGFVSSDGIACWKQAAG
jgi:hypothetical protein